jgi:hypothetical protein
MLERRLRRGNVMSTHCFVDAHHAGDTKTRWYQTGILLFCNRAPIIWFSKRQNSVEASTFGSEFTAMKNTVEMIEARRYKLCMFGVPINGPTNVICDNGYVCANTTRPESTLTKKHHSIAYHRCREAVAAETIRVSKERTLTDLSDIFTKTMAAPRREALLDSFTYCRRKRKKKRVATCRYYEKLRYSQIVLGFLILLSACQNINQIKTITRSNSKTNIITQVSLVLVLC